MSDSKSINSDNIPERYDARDTIYHYKGPTLTSVATYVNLLETHKAWLDDIYDQSTSSSCGANATAVTARFLARKSGLDKSNDPAADPSRLFIYYNARVLGKFLDENLDNRHWPTRTEIEDSGSRVRYLMRSIDLWGIAPEQEWSWATGKVLDAGTNKLEDVVVDINARPREKAYDTAKLQKVVEYCRLDPDHPNDVEAQMTDEEKEAVGTMTLARLRMCLTEGYPVVLLFSWYPNFEWIDPPASDPDFKRFPSLSAIPLNRRHLPVKEWQGHIVAAIGFDNERSVTDSNGRPIMLKKVVKKNNVPTVVEEAEKGAVLIQNSYRDKTAHFWMPYSYITDWEASTDFWMIRLLDLHAPTPPAPLVQPPRPTTVTVNQPWAVIRTIKERRLSLTPMSSTACSVFSFAAVIAYVLESGAVGIESYPLVGSLQGTHTEVMDEALRTANAGPGPIALSPYWAFWGSTNGALNGYFFGDQRVGKTGKYEILGPGSLAHGGGIVALATVENPGSVWWVTSECGIKGAWLPKDNPGTKWTVYELDGANSAAPASTIAAIKDVTFAGSVDLFWIGPDGTIRHRWKTADGLKWVSHTEVRAARNPAALTSHIAVVARGVPNALDVFYLAADGSLQWLAWDKDDPQRQWVVQTIAKGWASRVDTDLKAVRIGPNRLDVYFVSVDNGLYVVHGRFDLITNGSPWKDPVEIGAPGTVAAGTPLCVWPAKEDGSVWSVMFRDLNGNAVVANCSVGL